MFTFWLVVVVAGGLLQIVGGVLTLRHVRKRWKSAGDGRTFRAYLLERPRGWITAKIERARHWWRQRRRSAIEPITLQIDDTVQLQDSVVVTLTPGSLTVEAWPNAKEDPEGFAAFVREKLTESDTEINELRRELAARGHEIESKTQAELLAVKQTVDYVTNGIRSLRTEGLRSEFIAGALVVLGVALATLGAIGLVFWA